MRRLFLVRFLVLLLTFIFAISLCDAQTKGDRAPKPAKKGLFGLFSGKKRGSNVSTPKKPEQIKKEEAKKKKKLDDEYNKAAKKNRKNAFKIQTPAVQERMKQNQKNIEEREKARKKKTSLATKKAAKKYKK